MGAGPASAIYQVTVCGFGTYDSQQCELTWGTSMDDVTDDVMQGWISSSGGWKKTRGGGNPESQAYVCTFTGWLKRSSSGNVRKSYTLPFLPVCSKH